MAARMATATIAATREDDIVPNLVAADDTRLRSSCQANRPIASTHAFIGAYRYGTGTAAIDPDDPYATEEDHAHSNSGGALTPCPVHIRGNLRQRRDQFQDKVQSLRFEDFPGLSEYMHSNRAAIEKCHPQTLRDLHERFRTIVRDVLMSKKLYHSALGEMIQDAMDQGPSVGLYATPNVRLGRGTYATFLHSDAVLPGNTSSVSRDADATTDSSPTTMRSSSSSTSVAMMNVWMVLNDTPPSNQLVFYETLQEHTLAMDGKLHAKYEHLQGKTLVYDRDMCWGSFYCFVSGQTQSTSSGSPVLLHGAVDIPGSGSNREQRKSVELRYVV